MRRSLKAALITILVVTSFCFASSAFAEEEEKEKLSANYLRVALDKEVRRSWQSVPIRTAIRELTESTHVSILLDRNLDPATEFTLLAKPQPLRDLITGAAKAIKADAAQIGNVIFVGSPTTTDLLRTVIDSRQQELTKITSEKAKGPKNPWPSKRAELNKKLSLSWDDLDSPRDVLRRIPDHFPIQLEGIDQLPHDLWPAGSLPQMPLIESLSVLLVPFGATFEWVPDRLTLNIIPIPEQLIETAQAKNRRAGEENSTKPAPAGQATSKTTRPNTNQKSNSRTLTFKVQNAPIKDVLNSLRQQGIDIRADEQAFAAADIPFDKKIDFEVKKKTAEDICRELAKLLRCEITIQGDVVWLQPARKP